MENCKDCYYYSEYFNRATCDHKNNDDFSSKRHKKCCPECCPYKKGKGKEKEKNLDDSHILTNAIE